MAQRGESEHSRRSFLTRAAALAVPAALWSCRRDNSPAPGQATMRLPDAAGEERSAAGPIGPAASSPVEVVPRPPIAEPIVRVCIRQAREEQGAITIGSRGQWLHVGPAEAPDRSVVFRGPVEMRLGIDAWSVVDELGFQWSLGPRQSVQVSSLVNSEAVLAVGAQRYPGLMRLVPRSDVGVGCFDVVNHVGVEAYLPGVLARELYNHWHEQTHVAQAIAARSFACAEQQWFAMRRHYDLTSTQASQAYVGSVTHRRSVEAVATTRGEVLEYRGLLVSGYYSSCCGGVAARAADAIGPNPINALAPLEGRPGRDVCTAAPVFRWTARQARPTLVRRLRAFAQQESMPALEVRDLTSIEPSERNRHGRPVRYALTDGRGSTVQVGAETLRRAGNFSTPELPAPNQPLRSSNLQASFDAASNSVVFTGQGFGHGVGLCQHGAEALARSGADHRHILEWYYPAASMVSSYA